MKQFISVVGLVFVLTVILTFPEISRAQSNEGEIQTKGKVCPNPSSPCVKIESKGAKTYSDGDKAVISKGENIFEDWDLSFKFQTKLTWNHSYYSANFYAIILKSRPVVRDSPTDKEKCSQGYSEEERKEVQNMFPTNKVFVSRKGCDEERIGYTNADVGEGNNEFIAVYAGNIEAEAKKFLEKVSAKKEFSGANFRKMQVVYNYGDIHYGN